MARMFRTVPVSHRPLTTRVAATLVGATLVAGGLSACAKSSTSAAGGASDAIKVGVPVADTASLAKVGVSIPGSLSTADVKIAMSSALKAVSGTAAAGGRRLVVDDTTFDIVQPGAPQKACQHLIQDNHDDVVLVAQFVNGGDQCVVQRGGLLIQNVAAPQAAYSMPDGAVYTMDLIPDDAAKNFARYLTGDAGLRGRKVGVLTDALGGDAAPVTGVLLPALRAAGVDVVHVTTLTADLTQVAQQIPVEVAQMRDAGVSTIIDATPSANLAQFLGGMRKVGWNVPFIASDLNNAVDETFSPLYPPTFQATAITARRFTDTTGARADTCYQNYLTAGGKAAPVGSSGYQNVLKACDSATVLAAGLKQLGNTAFSKAAFQSALGKVGSLDLISYGPSGLQGSARSTVQGVRVVTWSKGGWQPNGDWTAVAHD